MTCPKCNKTMHSLGNVSGIIFGTYPGAWLETLACHSCRIKITRRVEMNTAADLSFLDNYQDLTEQKGG